MLDSPDRAAEITSKIQLLKVPEVPSLCDSFEGQKQRTNVGDCSLYTEIESGSGKYPLVILHGGPGATHHCFHPSFTQAKDSFSSIVYYDQRGCGSSDYIPGDNDYSVGQAVEDLEALRKQLGYGKWVVMGDSYGGILAQVYATKYQQNLTGLILVSSGLGFPNDLRTRQWLHMTEEEMIKINELHRRFRAGEIDESTLVYNLQMNGDWKRQDIKLPTLDEMAHKALHDWKHDPHFRERIVPDMHAIDLRGQFASFGVPTLIIEGKNDYTWDERKPDVLKQNHPNAELVVLPDAAHSPFNDQPEEFFRQISQFAVKIQNQ